MPSSHSAALNSVADGKTSGPHALLPSAFDPLICRTPVASEARHGRHRGEQGRTASRVDPLSVFRDHSITIESRSEGLHRSFHHSQPSDRQSGNIAVVVESGNLIFKRTIHRLGVSPV